MKTLRVYIDTSVVGGCLDEEFAHPSRTLIKMAREGRIALVVSDLLLVELQRAPAEVREIAARLFPVNVEQVTENEETRGLRDAYLKAGIVGTKHRNDAHHVALATVYRADLIVSWNFKHIVHYDKIRGFNAVNLMNDYSTIEIRSPREVIR